MSTEKPVTTATLAAALKHGHANGQSANALAIGLGTTPRAIRSMVDELIEAGTPVCAHPSTGYYIAETAEEIKETCEFLRSRALHGLAKAKQLRDAFVRASGIDPIQELEEQGAFA
jgi:biotin operon repressor